MVFVVDDEISLRLNRVSGMYVRVDPGGIRSPWGIDARPTESGRPDPRGGSMPDRRNPVAPIPGGIDARPTESGRPDPRGGSMPDRRNPVDPIPVGNDARPTESGRPDPGVIDARPTESGGPDPRRADS
ncbi:MAG: hypothetical protein JXA28_12045 [Bacteroidetes bacterium]|nr:hypothetical protein [Bacteroidota bacterium]